VACFAGFDDDGRFRVQLPEAAEPVCAISAVALNAVDVGSQVIVAFQDGDATRPVILGRVQERVAPAHARADGKRLVIRAEQEIELRCGEASIILTRAGKVLIRGAYVLTRSRGANKVKGAYVDIN
jgi:hypothetical protein